MAKLSINSEMTMNSGYKIPVLGYGVRRSFLSTQRSVPLACNFISMFTTPAVYFELLQIIRRESMI